LEWTHESLRAMEVRQLSKIEFALTVGGIFVFARPGFVAPRTKMTPANYFDRMNIATAPRPGAHLSGMDTGARATLSAAT